MIVISGKWHCGKGVKSNSVQCTVGKKWIHKRCKVIQNNFIIIIFRMKIKLHICLNSYMSTDIRWVGVTEIYIKI